VAAAHRDPSALAAIDAHYEAFVKNAVVNRASRIQGRAWLATIERAFPRPNVDAFCESVRASASSRHYAPLFGATLRILDIEIAATRRMYLFGICRGALSAAVRLGIVGTTDAQRVLAEFTSELDRTLDHCSTLTIEDAAQTAPLIDLWQSAHDRLYSRLFQS
jgi:urease accessory protein